MTNSSDLSNDVKIHAIRKRNGTRGSTYVVRWRVQGSDFQKTFTTLKLADGYRSELVAAANAGESFEVSTGRPRSKITHKSSTTTWLDHAIDFITMKWPDCSPKYRKSLAESLTKITTSLITEQTSRPSETTLRSALFQWAFNVPARKAAPPGNHATSIEWLRRNPRDLSDLADPATLRAVLEGLATNVDGSRASNATFTRRRSALFNALEYAVELKRLPSNPLAEIRRKRLPPTPALDRRRVANATQARALLAAVREQDPELEGFFATMYFAGPRPGEVLNIRRSDVMLPKSGWGKLLLLSSYQRAGEAWTDTGEAGEERELKHRAASDTRDVPIHPELVQILRRHIERYKIPRAGRLFVARNGKRGNRLPANDEKPVSMKTIYRAWGRAREQALTELELASPLARRPYDLRHACLSTWLNAGVAPVQVAEWAGHGVAVLLSVYAKCIDGQEGTAMQRIEQALEAETSASSQPDDVDHG